MREAIDYRKSTALCKKKKTSVIIARMGRLYGFKLSCAGGQVFNSHKANPVLGSRHRIFIVATEM